MWISFSTSPSIRRVTGMPVHLPTTSATSSSVTSSVSIVPPSACSSASCSSGSVDALLELGDARRSAARRRARGRRRARRARPRGGPRRARPWRALIASIAAFSFCQRAFISPERLAELGELGLDRVEPLLRGLVLLLLQRLALDLELLDAALDLVDLGRHRVDLDLQPRGGLVDQVDRLVGQEAVGDVALGERRGGDDRRVGDADAVVDLVALLEPAQDRDRVLDRRARRRRPAGSGARAPRPSRCACGTRRAWSRRRTRSSPRASIGFSRLAASTAPSAAPAPTIVCSSSMKRTIRPVGVLDLLEHGLEALLELAAVLGAGEQRADVERDHAAVAQRLGDVAGDDALGEALDDRGLADAGLADQDGVVLGAAREHLDHAADLLVAADHRVELAALGLGGQVAAELLERLELSSGLGEVTRCGPADLGDRLDQRRRGRGAASATPGVLVGEGEQEVLGRDVLVAERGHLLLGALERPRRSSCDGPDVGHGRRRSTVRQLGDRLAGALARSRRRRRRACCSTGTTRPSSCSSRAASRCAGATSGLRASERAAVRRRRPPGP